MNPAGRRIAHFGKTPGVTLLLVDDRDGEGPSLSLGRRRWSNLGRETMAPLPDYLSLGEVRSHQGSLVGTDSLARVKPAGLGGFDRENQ
jgi:hypothetical protein